MKQVVSAWFNRYFSDPQAVFVTIALIILFVVIYFWGAMLMPAFASIVIAYLLEGLAYKLERHRVPRMVAVMMVFLLFVTILLLLLFGVLPLLSAQVTQFFSEIPNMVDDMRKLVLQVPKAYPEFVTEIRLKSFLDEFEADMQSKLGDMTQAFLSFSIASIQSVMTMTIYLVLLPILVFFFLKDKQMIVNWFMSLLPKERKLAGTIWTEVDMQIGNYIRGKIAEILIIGVVTFIAFGVLDIRYAALLAALVGISVLVPYIGAVVVTVPVLIVAYFQWGWSPEFFWLFGVYMVIQVLDGNILVPLLFSEVVNLHPIAIIVAVLFFGGLWGFWGVFFAIPLATFVKALMKAWPRTPGNGNVLESTNPSLDLDQTVMIRKD